MSLYSNFEKRLARLGAYLPEEEEVEYEVIQPEPYDQVIEALEEQDLGPKGLAFLKALKKDEPLSEGHLRALEKVSAHLHLSLQQVLDSRQAHFAEEREREAQEAAIAREQETNVFAELEEMT